MSIEIPDDARCLGCSYLLRGLPEPRCPECGRPFDPDDPETYRRPSARRVERLHAWLHRARPPGPLYVSALMLAAAVVILANTSPKTVFAFPRVFDSLCCLPAGAGLPACIVVLVADYLRRHLLLREAKRRGDTQAVQAFQRHKGRWRRMGVCVALMLLTLLYPWPAHLRFYASWPALHREAHRYLSGDFSTERDLRIGLLHVEYVFGYGRGFVFFQTGHDWRHRYGFVYRPSRPAPNQRRPDRQWRPISPHWYLERW